MAKKFMKSQNNDFTQIHKTDNSGIRTETNEKKWKIKLNKKNIIIISIVVLVLLAIVLLIKNTNIIFNNSSNNSNTASNSINSNENKNNTTSDNSKATDEKSTNDNNSSNTAYNNNFGDYLSLENEKVIFFFESSENKFLSLCVGANEEYIVYRYGTPDNVELEFPKDRTDSWKKFKFEDSVNFQGEYLNRISFEDSNTNYTIYEKNNMYKNQLSIGVTVSYKKSKSDIKGKIETKFGSIFGLDSLFEKLRDNNNNKSLKNWRR